MFFYSEYATLFSWPVLLINNHLSNYKHSSKNTMFPLINKYLLIIKSHF